MSVSDKLSNLRKQKRFLTNKELDDAVSLISGEIKEEQRKLIKKVLSQEKVYPSVIPKIKENIKLLYESSVIPKIKENIEPLYKSSLISTSNYINLDSFHNLGSTRNLQDKT